MTQLWLMSIKFLDFFESKAEIWMCEMLGTDMRSLGTESERQMLKMHIVIDQCAKCKLKQVNNCKEKEDVKTWNQHSS
jgi:hypothetical protein